ncbi:MAG: DUF5703 domain-containing protein [Planctomycetaceae bacterium]|nr:DUF5703 domain-containing protein [Planctomycetaceae bacterium]
MTKNIAWRTGLNIALLIFTWAASVSLGAAGPAGDGCDVVWDSPSADQLGSMPLGNGDISVNAWVEPSGELGMLIGKTDSFSENGRLLKIGRVRVKFSPPLPVQPFSQRLALQDGQMIVTAGQDAQATTLRVWVDAHNPVIRVECEGAAARGCTASVELWRTQEKPYTVNPGEHSEQGLTQADKTLVDLADIVVPAAPGSGQIVWYHRNTRSIYPLVLRLQHLEKLAATHADPLLNRTFGAAMWGSGMTAGQALVLTSAAPQTRRVISIAVLTAQTTTPEAWLDQIKTLSGRIAALDVAKSRQAHQQWWKDFWQRSWIVVRDAQAGQPDKISEAQIVTRGYALQRYMLACCSRGPLPPKFNGATFTVDGPGIEPDFRRWGSNYWFQNNRWLVWPMPACGDYEMMQPFFDMYLQALPLAKDRTRLYYDHEGAFFPETMYFWCTPNLCDFGLTNPGKEPSSAYIRYYWQGGIELVAMMLDRYDHTQDDAFASKTLVPMAESIMLFFDRHWKRGADGKIRFHPAQSLETWQDAVNPLPEIAGLRYVLPRLLALPEKLTTPAQRQVWTKMLADLPAVPTLTRRNKRLLAPAETFGRSGNTENAELYALFPYRLYGAGLPQIELARDSFNARRFRKDGCWSQDAVHAAAAGEAAAARKSVVAHFSTSTQPQRFPAFWHAGNDWRPDMDNGGTAMTALQHMLMQTDRRKIHLLPAWPAGWDADFKLHAPYNTTIEAKVRAGKIENLKVTPESRLKDILAP